MPPTVKLSAAERIFNILAHVPRPRGEDFMARQKREADAIRPVIDDVRDEGVIAGLELALSMFPRPHSTTQWDAEDAIRAEIARLKARE